MTWRKIKKEDIKRGVLIRMKSMENDGSYCMATIINTRSINFIKVARPYAYSYKEFNSIQPLLGCEVFDIYFERLFAENSDIEVFEGRNGIQFLET